MREFSRLDQADLRMLLTSIFLGLREFRVVAGETMVITWFYGIPHRGLQLG